MPLTTGARREHTVGWDNARTRYIGARLTIMMLPAVKAFLNSAMVHRSSQLYRLFEFITDESTHISPTHFKKFAPDIFEFKSHQLRIICTFTGQRELVLVHAMEKKQTKFSQRERREAIRMVMQYRQTRGLVADRRATSN